MLKITDTVKVISKTNCGGIMKELIPVGTICIIVSEHKDKDGSIYYGVTPFHNRNDLFYYLESELEKGSLQWVKESESPSGSEENGHVVWVTAKPLIAETLLKQAEEIPDFAEKMNEICCGTMTSYDESTWIAPYIISTIRECKTDREFEIANTMLTCCCGASFESLINQIIDQDLLTSLIGKTFAAKLFLDELQNIFEQKYGFELCWDNKETEVWDGKEYRKMNFHCWHPQNILRMFWMFLEYTDEYVKILDGYLEVL